jgi:hypothetical protein
LQAASCKALQDGDMMETLTQNEADENGSSEIKIKKTNN